MAITKIIENSGNQTVTSGNGRITIDQATGEILVRNGSKVVTRIDEDGFKYFDSNNIKRISLGQNAEGQQQIVVYGTDGKAQILVGQDPKDSTPVIAVSESGTDVLTELQNG